MKRRLKGGRKILSILVTLSLCFGLTQGVSAVWKDYSDNTNVFRFKRNDGMKIALTFDDGPNHVYTEQILDILKENEVHGTFFVIGENAKIYPDLIAREIAEGHEVGNHTYHHPHLRKLTKDAVRDEILLGEEALYEIDDYRPKLFRPPEGMCSEEIIACAEELDYHVILWSIDTLDWAHNSVENITEMIMTNIRDGDIILFHDHVTKISPTPEVLKIIIPRLKEMGYSFVTVSELIGTQ